MEPPTRVKQQMTRTSAFFPKKNQKKNMSKKTKQYESVFPLLSNTYDDGNNDVTKVEARFAWLIQTCTASQRVFALQLQHDEPDGSFHPTMRAVLAANNDALDCWLRLEQCACERKLLTLQAELGKVCREYKIMLKPGKDKCSFKFPHQRRALDTDDICASLAEHGFPLLEEEEQRVPSSQAIDVAKWVTKARALLDVEEEDDDDETPQPKKRPRSSGGNVTPLI